MGKLAKPAASSPIIGVKTCVVLWVRLPPLSLDNYKYPRHSLTGKATHCLRIGSIPIIIMVKQTIRCCKQVQVLLLGLCY